MLLVGVYDSRGSLDKEIRCCDSSDNNRQSRHYSTTPLHPYAMGKRSVQCVSELISQTYTDCMYREHKTNSEYKKNLFTSISSQEYGSPFLHDRNIKGLFDPIVGFSPSGTNRHSSGLLVGVWRWWNVAVCSILHALEFSAPFFFLVFFCHLLLSSLADFLFTVQDHTLCRYAAICIPMCFRLGGRESRGRGRKKSDDRGRCRAIWQLS